MPGADEVNRRLKGEMPRRVAGVFALIQIFAKRVEAQAKENAPWLDRTGHARKGLKGTAELEGEDIVLRLSHSVDYGLYLELAHGGKYAILRPTLESNLAEIKKTVRDYWEGTE